MIEANQAHLTTYGTWETESEAKVQTTHCHQDDEKKLEESEQIRSLTPAYLVQNSFEFVEVGATLPAKLVSNKDHWLSFNQTRNLVAISYGKMNIPIHPLHMK